MSNAALAEVDSKYCESLAASLIRLLFAGRLWRPSFPRLSLLPFAAGQPSREMTTTERKRRGEEAESKNFIPQKRQQKRKKVCQDFHRKGFLEGEGAGLPLWLLDLTH